MLTTHAHKVGNALNSFVSLARLDAPVDLRLRRIGEHHLLEPGRETFPQVCAEVARSEAALGNLEQLQQLKLLLAADCVRDLPQWVVVLPEGTKARLGVAARIENADHLLGNH